MRFFYTRSIVGRPPRSAPLSRGDNGTTIWISCTATSNSLHYQAVKGFRRFLAIFPAGKIQFTHSQLVCTCLKQRTPSAGLLGILGALVPAFFQVILLLALKRTGTRRGRARQGIVYGGMDGTGRHSNIITEFSSRPT